MFQWYAKVLRDYLVFAGRAGRREYWYFGLCNLLIFLAGAIVAGIVESVTGAQKGGPLETAFGILYMLYVLALLLPSIAVSVRRLHDTGRTGWWLLLTFLPIVGPLVLLVFYIFDSDPGENKYGPNPKGVASQFLEPT